MMALKEEFVPCGDDLAVPIGVSPPPARQLGAPPPPPATPPPPDLAEVELLATEHLLGQPSNKTRLTSANLTTETNNAHFQFNPDAPVFQPRCTSVGEVNVTNLAQPSLA